MNFILSLIVIAIVTVIVLKTIMGMTITDKKENLRDKNMNRLIAENEDKPISTAVQKVSEDTIIWNNAFLRSLEWKRYEEVCMEYLRIKNCDANVTSTGADGGIDIKVKDKNGNLLAIGQCKAWNKPIGVSLIRELYGVMASERIKHGVFLTTSTFSQEAMEFAKNKSLLLIDGDEFVKLINGLDVISKRRINNLATEGDYSIPTCVKCNVKMVKRVTKKGTHAGKEFWGCINFPKCKKTMYVKI